MRILTRVLSPRHKRPRGQRLRALLVRQLQPRHHRDSISSGKLLEIALAAVYESRPEIGLLFILVRTQNVLLSVYPNPKRDDLLI